MDIIELLKGQFQSALNPAQPEKQPPPQLNFIPEESEQAEIVGICNELKKNMQAHARPKKTAMRECYAYVKGQFVGKDLLPIPSTTGSQKDITKDRPKAFYPLTKQQLKQLYSYIKLTMFPDDENYARVKGNDPTSAQFEQGLTEGLMYVLRKMLFSEKVSMSLWNALWAGNCAASPYIKRRTIWEWEIKDNQYQSVQKELDPEIDIENFNPINFYVDPTATDNKFCKWSYYSIKKVQEMKDNPLFFNTDKLKDIAKKNLDRNENNNSLSLDLFNGLNNVFVDTEDNIDYDHYYFPYIKTSRAEYRNMIFGVAGQNVLVRCHPNLFPGGRNPCIFSGWMQDVDSQYCTGPAEDIKELQKLINIIANYKIETMARMGNRFVVTPSVDMTDFWGIAGGVMKATNPAQDVVNITGNYTEISHLDNTIAILKAEAQMTSGAQDPFQGGANIDFKKTATEMQMLERNFTSNKQEAIEHIGITFVEPLLSHVMHLLADVYTEPFKIRIEDPHIAQRLGAEADPITGYNYFTVDFSMLKNPQLSFSVELMGTNPSQSKQAEVESLTELLQAIGAMPQIVFFGAPIIQKIGELQGIKNIDNLIQQLQEKVTEMQGAMNGPQQPGVQPAQANMAAGQQPGMGGMPQALPGAQATQQ